MSTFQETAKNLIDKGAEVMSGLASSASDAATKAKIKMKIADLSLEEGKLMQSLGRAAHDELGDDVAFRETHAELFDRIDEVLLRKQAFEDELANMDASIEDATDAPDERPIDVEAVVVAGGDAAQPDARSSEGDAE